MNVTVSPLGMVLIPLGLLLFVQSRRQLFWATVVSIPFFYTFVFDLGFTVIQTYQYFGILLVLRSIVDLALTKDDRRLTLPVPGAVVLLFLLISYLSLLMPKILQGTMYVVPAGTRYQEYENVELLAFSIKNLSQIAYPTFMILLFLNLMREIRDMQTVKNVVRLGVAISFVVILSGLFFQVSLFSGYRGPLELLFRVVTGHTDVSRIYYGAYYNMIGGLPRMFTLVGEPGYTSSYLLYVFAILAGLHYGITAGGWKPKHGRKAMIVVLAGLALAGSTTGYLGLVLLVVMLFLLPKVFRLGHSGSRLRATVSVSTIVAVVLVMVLIAAPIVIETSFVDYFYGTHYAKLFEQEGSGSVRLATAASGVEVFLKSPILGVGFGSHRTAAVLTSLLSNVGLIGTLAFLWFNVLMLRRGVRVCRNSNNRELVSICYALLVGFATLFPVMLVAKSMVALIQGWYWLVLAMIEGCHRVYRREAVADSPPVQVPEARPIVSAPQPWSAR